MSDRAFPSNHLQNKHHIRTSGLGVDIKYNSYNRFLNRLKGKGSIKRGIIPPNYGIPIPFNRAYPIRGGKTVKTAIINGPNCVCPSLVTDDLKYISNEILPTTNYVTSNINNNGDIFYIPNVGDIVWVLPNLNSSKELKGHVL